MSTRIKSIDALLDRSTADLVAIEKHYYASLRDQLISSELKIDIKNLLENLRSALDYLARSIRTNHCLHSKPDAVFYFPILQSPQLFSQKMAQWFPRLDVKCPKLYSYLESIQPYHKDFMWLGQFNKINNDNKHTDLVEQTKLETNQVTVTAPNTIVSWNPSSVTFGSGVFIGDVPVDPATQLPVPHPSQEVKFITWVDFRFTGINVSALLLLKSSLEGIRDIVMQVCTWL